MIRAVIASVIVLLTVGACGGPLRFGPPMPPGLEALGATATEEPHGDRASNHAVKNAPTAPAEGELAVGSEAIAPGDIWRDQLLELRRRRQSTPPSEFQRWVVQQSASLITDMIAERLLYQAAKEKLGDDADPRVQSYVDGEIRKVVTEKFGGVQRRYEKSLEEQGQKLADVRRNLRRAAIIGAYVQSNVRGRIAEPTRAELLEAFESQRDNLRRPGRRSMSLIDIRTNNFYPPGLSSPTRAQSATATDSAHTEALAALAELRSGTSFADVARRRSHGLHAIDGGKWGWITANSVRDRFLPAVGAMEGLSEGQVSGVIRVPDGFFIVFCDQVQDAFEPDFVTVQPLILNQIAIRRQNQAIGAEVSRLRAEAGITEDSLRDFHRRVVASALATAIGDPNL